VTAADGRERLQKVLAQAGVASRRDCEELIREGRVEVDRHVVTELGTRVDRQQQEIRVDGEALATPKLVYFAVNKPIGVVSTSSDPAGRPRVIDLLPPNAPRVFCVGRLDLTTEGLILVTNDGELANGLTHPRHGVEKIYHVQVAGQVERDVLAQLHRGVHLAEGYAHVKHVRIKSRRKRSTILEMVLDEGRNREVRRLLARVGHKVQRLKRIAVGPVRLADLPAGAVRPLTKKEIQSLEFAVVRGSEPKVSSNTEPHHPRVSKRRPDKNHKGHKAHKETRTVIGG
jgi:23S rRNA pseudouridine2605 synthase